LFLALLAKESSNSAVKFGGHCKPNVTPSLGKKMMNIGDKLAVVALYDEEEKKQ
jgi:hypothetical protein